MIRTGRITDVSSASTFRVFRRTLRAIMVRTSLSRAAGRATAAAGKAVRSDTDGLLVFGRDCGGVSGQGEEYVVERRGVDREAAYRPAGGIQLVEQVADMGGAAVGGDADGEAGDIAGDGAAAEDRRHRVKGGAVDQRDLEPAPGEALLERGRCVVGHDATAVEDGDPIRQLVGLLQVLRGEDDGHP